MLWGFGRIFLKPNMFPKDPSPSLLPAARRSGMGSKWLLPWGLNLMLTTVINSFLVRLVVVRGYSAALDGVPGPVFA